MLSNCNDTFDTSGLDGTSDDSPEPGVSVANDAYDEADLSKYLFCEDGSEQEDKKLVGDIALEFDSLPTDLMESPSYRGGLHLELPHAAPELRNPHAPSAQATMEPVRSFEQVGRLPRPDRFLQPPSIVVSDSANADGNPRTSFESCSSTPLPTSQMGIKGTAVQYSRRSMAPLQQQAHPGDLDGIFPTNYELATQDRQPPDIPTEIEPQSERNAAVSLRAFCTDADSIATEATAVYYADTNLLHVEGRGLTRDHSGFQTTVNRCEPSENAQKLSANPRYSSAAHESSRIFTYLSPPSSRKSSPTYLHSDGAYSRESTPMIPPTQSCNVPIEPLSPVSPSPYTVPQADDRIARCPHCPDTVFKGPNRKNSLQRHQRDHHNGMPRLECLVRGCAVTFAPGRKDNRLKHVKAAHSGFPLPSSFKKRKRKLGSK